MNDAIFALASASGRAAVAVIRLSGEGTRAILTAVAGSPPAPRRAAVRRVKHPNTGEVLDHALVLWFPGPGSFTGEDSAELQIHGGRAAVEAVSEALAAAGARLAEPGEFSRRAFQNGKLDLTQAEAIADLVDAETSSQRRQALGQLEGGLSARYAAWRAQLVQALARLEAIVDFPDEELPPALMDELAGRIDALAGALEEALADEGRGERIREGYRIALIGAPNAGKSSLLNRLVGREAAIVHSQAGTTRDVIEAPATIEGYRVLFADMAGLREADDPVEQEGVRRARAWAEGADLRLWVVDASLARLDAVEAQALARVGDVLVLNKTDLPAGRAGERAAHIGLEAGLTLISASATAGGDLQALDGALRARVTALGGGEFPAVTRLRHRRHLLSAARDLRRAQSALADGPELAAEDLRRAASALGRIAGRIDPEQVLDEVFASFCIGK